MDTEGDAIALGNIFGKVKARLAWSKLFETYLTEAKNEPLFSKVDAIHYIIYKNSANQAKLLSFFNLLFGEHRYTTKENLILVNEHLRSFGLGVDENLNIFYITTGGNSFPTEVTDLLNTLCTKSMNEESLVILKHHMDAAQGHFGEKKWDDTSSQLRKAFECLISFAASRNSTAIPESVNGQLKVLVSQGVLTENEKDSFYALYGMLSDKGAHPGIAGVDELLFRHRLVMESARYLAKLL